MTDHADRSIRPTPRLRRAFSLIELVIVVVIIAVIAAIAVPRFSGAATSAGEAALKNDLVVLRKALDFYRAEHLGNAPISLNALIRYTNERGSSMAATRSATFPLGPYIRAIPPCPVGPRKGATDWVSTGNNPPVVEAAAMNVGWLYHAASGNVWVNDSRYFDW